VRTSTPSESYVTTERDDGMTLRYIREKYIAILCLDAEASFASTVSVAIYLRNKPQQAGQLYQNYRYKRENRITPIWKSSV